MKFPIGILPLALGISVLAGCAGETPTATDADTVFDNADALFVMDGYRGADDPCRRVGESAATVEFLDHTADLVGCVAGSPAAASFPAETGGNAITVIDGIQLFSVPRG